MDKPRQIALVYRKMRISEQGSDVEYWLSQPPGARLAALNVIQLGCPPRRIDLLIGLEGAAFEECYSARLEEEMEGIRVGFIDRENLARLKRAAGRPQDLSDLDNRTR